MVEKTYSLEITFNKQLIRQIIITDHYRAKHSEVINDQLIVEIFENYINGLEAKPDLDYLGEREIYSLIIRYQNKNYRLVFWYDNQRKDILWVKNCYRKD